LLEEERAIALAAREEAQREAKEQAEIAAAKKAEYEK